MDLAEEVFILKKEKIHPFWLMLMRIGIYFISTRVITLFLSHVFLIADARIFLLVSSVSYILMLVSFEYYCAQKVVLKKNYELNIQKGKEEFIFKERLKKYLLYCFGNACAFIFLLSYGKAIPIILLMICFFGYYMELYLDNQADFIKKGEQVEKSWKRFLFFQRSFKFFPYRMQRNFLSRFCGFIGRVCRLFFTLGIFVFVIGLVWLSVPSIFPNNLGIFLYRLHFYEEAVPYLKQSCLEDGVDIACKYMYQIREKGIIAD